MLTPGVDTFATLPELRARATDFGATLPAEDAACEVLLRRAAEQMAAWPWQGWRTLAGQPLCWPRADVPGVAPDAVPLAVKQAQCALAVELHRDDLDPPEQRRGPVVRERVDVLDVEYADVRPASSRPRASLVLASPYLAPVTVQAVRA